MAASETVIHVGPGATEGKAWRKRVLGHIGGLQTTQVPPLLPILLGMVAGVSVGLLLLFGSL